MAQAAVRRAGGEAPGQHPGHRRGCPGGEERAGGPFQMGQEAGRWGAPQGGGAGALAAPQVFVGFWGSSAGRPHGGHTRTASRPHARPWGCTWAGHVPPHVREQSVLTAKGTGREGGGWRPPSPGISGRFCRRRTSCRTPGLRRVTAEHTRYPGESDLRQMNGKFVSLGRLASQRETAERSFRTVICGSLLAGASGWKQTSRASVNRVTNLTVAAHTAHLRSVS